uniref:Metabotropic glutamate receptor 4like [Chrysemys picta] n=1 Tax=Lepeophtheirus salmonis TaxID=72036 RepID=A0A0K2T2I7_LEPSM
MIQYLLYILVFVQANSLTLGQSRCPDIEGVPKYDDPPFIYKSGVTAQKTITLLSMFPIHEIGCKKILSVKNYNGLQRARAMLYALEKVNERVASGNRSVAIDAVIYSTCSNQISSVGTTAHFINTFPIGQIGGFVGCSYSSTSVEVSKILQAYNISMISYAATSKDLSNKFNHPLFGRTLPSDSAQARVVFDLTQELGWTSVTILVSERSKYSESLRDAFYEANKLSTKKMHICSVENFPKSIDNFEDKIHFDDIIHRILQSKVDGFIGFVTADTKQAIFDHLNVMNIDHYANIRFIGTDSWDISFNPSKKLSQIFENSYVVLPESPNSALKVPLGKRIRKEFHYDNVPIVEANGNNWMNAFYDDFYTKPCKEDRDCMKKQFNSLKLDTKIDFAADTILVYSNAFERGKNEDFTKRSFFWDYVMVDDYDDISKMNFQFEPCTGDRIVSYSVYRLNKFGEYEKIGSTHHDLDQVGMLDTFPATFARMQCRPECDLADGQYEDFHSVSDCCYSCAYLSYRHFRPSLGQQEECNVGEWPNATDHYRSCYPLIDAGLNLSDPWVIVSLFLASIGICITSSVICIGVQFRKHPVFKSASMEMAYFIWAGVLICHLNTFFIILVPSGTLSCSIERFTRTIGYTVFLSALLLKTHRIFKIFIGQFQDIDSNLRWIKPKYQIITAFCLILIQFIIVCIWLGIEPPRPFSVYPGERHVKLCITGAGSTSLAQLYNIGICVVTTAYSFLSRNVPQKFNESRFINITMYSICIGWPIEFLSKSFLRNISSDNIHQRGFHPEKNIGISTLVTSLCATFVIIFLFSNKIYVIFKKRKEGENTQKREGSKLITMKSMEL